MYVLVALCSHNTEDFESIVKYLNEAPAEQEASSDADTTQYAGTSPKRQRYQRIKQSIVKEIVEHYTAGESTKSLAVRYSIARSTVSSILKREGIEKRTQESTTAEDRELMQQLRDNGTPLAAIAERFGVHEKTVWNHTR